MVKDARHFLFNSDAPLDVVVGKWTGTEVFLPNQIRNVNIPHNLPFTPLLFGQFSIDGGKTWTPQNVDYLETNGWINVVMSDNTNITIRGWSLNEPITAQYRIWAFPPSDVSINQEVMPIEPTSDYNINSDYGYSQLINAGKWEVVPGTKEIILKHNLGYIPQVIYWIELENGRISEDGAVFSHVQSKQGNGYLQIDENNLYGEYTNLDYSESKLKYIHYRIYGQQLGG